MNVRTDIGRLRLIAIMEGISLLSLFLISLPLKHLFGISVVSQILGPLHGALFLLFVFQTLSYGVEHRWKFQKTTWKVLLACLIPFGTFYIDHKILKPLEKRTA